MRKSKYKIAKQKEMTVTKANCCPDLDMGHSFVLPARYVVQILEAGKYVSIFSSTKYYEAYLYMQQRMVDEDLPNVK